MANKFLIVCGGSGSGLLGKRSVLSLNGELQIPHGTVEPCGQRSRVTRFGVGDKVEVIVTH